MNNRQIRVMLAQPRGFCAGVERAINVVEAALEKYGSPVYVRHEIVHNRRVVENLKAMGAIFVEEVEQIPEGAITVFSAHGVSRKVVDDAKERSLSSIDATCPLVTKVHTEGRLYAKKGFEVILIGHENHPEVEGTMGQIPGKVHLISDIDDVVKLKINDPDKVAFVTQTTLSVDDTLDIINKLKERFPNIKGPDTKDICYASQNRQRAVRVLASRVDLVLVVGAQNSSNSNRLRDVSREAGVASYLIDDPANIDEEWLRDVESIGITAGASTPEDLVMDVVDRLRKFAKLQISTMDGIVENVQFKPPKTLYRYSAASA